jgi:hypothetical protein
MRAPMVWEWNWPAMCWDWSTFVWFSVDIHTTHRGDHRGFGCLLMVAGIKLLDFGWYSREHA